MIACVIRNCYLDETNSRADPTVRMYVELEVPTLGPHALCALYPFLSGGEQGCLPRLLEKKYSRRGCSCKRLAKRGWTFEPQALWTSFGHSEKDWNAFITYVSSRPESSQKSPPTLGTKQIILKTPHFCGLFGGTWPLWGWSPACGGDQLQRVAACGVTNMLATELATLGNFENRLVMVLSSNYYCSLSVFQS